MEKQSRRRIIAIILFIVAMCFTELSPFSSRAVEMINGGYGTFDMKSYDPETFVQVMEATTNMAQYWKYYIFDFLFTAAFLNFMVQFVKGFDGKLARRIRPILYALAVIRACFDITENCILLNQIYSYPNYSLSLIKTCNMITTAKFGFMWCWMACFLVMVISQVVEKRKR